MSNVYITKQTLRRLPLYFNYLKALPPETQNVSAASIAVNLGLNAVLVRKDLALVSSGGKPKTGYVAQKLINDIHGTLRSKEEIQTAIIGMGNLGLALASNHALSEYGLQIAAAFDLNPAMVNRTIGGIRVYSNSKLEQICRQKGVRVGIITVARPQVQAICDRLVLAGVMAIWNLTPVHIHTPKGVLVQNEDIGPSLALLTNHLTQVLFAEEDKKIAGRR